MNKTTVRIDRYQGGAGGVIGNVYINDIWFCHSLELAYRDNRVGVSSIPAATYQCKMTFSQRFQKPLYLVIDVPNRVGIRFHAANYAGDRKLNQKSELEGCIALGNGFTLVSIGKEKQLMLLDSAKTMDEFHRRMKELDFTLTIHDYLSTTPR
jgi:hypothetical protein